MLGFRVGAEIIINVLAWTSAKAHSMCSSGKSLPWDNSRFEAALPTHSDAGFGVNLFFIGLASGPHVGSRDAGPCRSVWAKVLALY